MFSLFFFKVIETKGMPFSFFDVNVVVFLQKGKRKYTNQEWVINP